MTYWTKNQRHQVIEALGPDLSVIEWSDRMDCTQATVIEHMRTAEWMQSNPFRTAVRALGITQAAAAAELGVHESTVGRWWLGKATPPVWVMARFGGAA